MSILQDVEDVLFLAEYKKTEAAYKKFLKVYEEAGRESAKLETDIEKIKGCIDIAQTRFDRAEIVLKTLKERLEELKKGEKK